MGGSYRLGLDVAARLPRLEQGTFPRSAAWLQDDTHSTLVVKQGRANSAAHLQLVGAIMSGALWIANCPITGFSAAGAQKCEAQ